MKYNIFMKNIFYFLFYINKKFKQKVRTMVKVFVRTLSLVYMLTILFLLMFGHISFFR